MAPTGQQIKNKKFTAKGGDWKKSTNRAQGAKQKRKWVPEQKVYEGSVKEGQGFALKRKEKVKHEYNKLLRKERKKLPESKALYKDEYPEHLRHLYVAEAKKLKNEAWTHRFNRSILRMKGQEKEEEMGENAGAGATAAAVTAAAVTAAAVTAAAVTAAAVTAAAVTAAEPDPEVTVGPEQTDPGPENPETTADAKKDSLPVSNRMKKKMLKKTSYQKTKEEFEAITEKRKNKKEEYLKNSQQKEEAIQKYKDKKMEMFQMLSKKTKRGQPNLNLQMEYLLQKITQGTGK